MQFALNLHTKYPKTKIINYSLFYMISLHVKKTTIMIKKKKRQNIFIKILPFFFFFPEKSLNPEAWDKFIIFFSDHPKLNFKPSKRSPTTNQFNLKYVKKKKQAQQ